jgi:hypothetical protein
MSHCSKLDAGHSRLSIAGGLAQLARALALQAKGHRFESDILHGKKYLIVNTGQFFYIDN